MKIGKFAAGNKVSIDTVRYYMELGLIVPEKKGGHYHFDERCQKDLKDILIFKDMGFTMKEIKSVFLFKRLGKLTPYQTDEYFKNIFINKYQEIIRELANLQGNKNKLEKKIKKLSTKVKEPNFKIGLDINDLDIFSCNKCGGNLVLSEGQIKNNQILNGKLNCKCGQEYIVQDGILIVDNKFIKDNHQFNQDHISKYINNTSLEYLDHVYKGLEWACKKGNFKEFNDRKILELGSGVGFLLRNIYSDLADDTLYLAVDHDLEKHRFLKSNLERLPFQKKVIFICADFLDLPLKEKIVDMIIDYSGSSNYSFEHEEFLLKLMDKYSKDCSYLLSTYILFKNFSSNSFIKEKYRKYFKLENIKSEINKLHYKLIDERITDFVKQGGEFENYFRDNEQVYFCALFGQRWS